MTLNTLFDIPPLNTKLKSACQALIDNKTKPLGALGLLEPLALQLALILTRSENHKIELGIPQLVIFAGDHGIAAEGVSIAPSEVTGQMVANFSNGGAAINALCQTLGWQLSVVDCGILVKPELDLNVISQRLGTSTNAFHRKPAMERATLERGFDLANALINNMLEKGTNIFAFGEMGIGNTTSASAIFSAISLLSPKETVGKGTGVSDEIVMKKQSLIADALSLHHKQLDTPIGVLQHLGGYEIVQMVASMLTVAKAQKVIVVDGFIATAAALIATQLAPNAKDYMVFAHCSGEQGHQKMLEYLEVTPLLNLGLRLGEGTGAALALPLLQSAAAFYNDMASFTDANVTEVNG
ncbi:nicotinate-nucleotide--dimethylbenzimidazole phosphoribosyltransferase [Pseudoalteromonas xiamenensis]|uniref:nicotinate-nucleotide--dimethylbenzimidazole phosphoribosyltransferase n=1 Tax=Pseudoalteromonas xiamenensis TaxID=882626 RepID=UPI0035E8F58B